MYKIFAITALLGFFCSTLFAEPLENVDAAVREITIVSQGYEQKLQTQEEKCKALEDEIKSLKNQINELKKSKKSTMEESLVSFSPTTFQTQKEAPLYPSAKSREVVEYWEKGRSFTAYQKQGERIRISGYFVEKVWQKAEGDLWIDAADVAKKF